MNHATHAEIQPFDLEGCARCGNDHISIGPWQPFTRPIPSDDGSPEWTHWTTCPATGDPVLLKDDEARPSYAHIDIPHDPDNMAVANRRCSQGPRRAPRRERGHKMTTNTPTPRMDPRLIPDRPGIATVAVVMPDGRWRARTIGLEILGGAQGPDGSGYRYVIGGSVQDLAAQLTE